MAAGELTDRLRHGLADYRLYSEESPHRTPRARLGEMAGNLARGLGLTSFRGRSLQFTYRGYVIPLDLAEMTGGAADTWHEIVEAHLGYYERWAPVSADSDILEVGCGIGRDAMRLAELLGPDGSYVGVDITEPSIRWCRRNITRRHRNIRFAHLDVASPMYNPTGTLTNTEVVFPLADGSVDRVVLHSVFTHMVPAHVEHYLGQISRVLRRGGLVLASFFLVDDGVLDSARRHGSAQTFRYPGPDGCRLNDEDHPEAAIAYSLADVRAMAQRCGLQLVDHHPGFWSGAAPAAPNGQDIVVFRPESAAG